MKLRGSGIHSSCSLQRIDGIGKWTWKSCPKKLYLASFFVWVHPGGVIYHGYCKLHIKYSFEETNTVYFIGNLYHIHLLFLVINYFLLLFVLHKILELIWEEWNEHSSNILCPLGYSLSCCKPPPRRFVKLNSYLSMNRVFKKTWVMLFKFRFETMQDF
jgi:hypothetical protein